MKQTTTMADTLHQVVHQLNQNTIEALIKPALEKIQNEWVMPALLCDDNPWYHLTFARPFGEVVIGKSDRFHHHEKYYELMNKEWMMKQVNCVSKGVRAELIQTAGTSQYVNVALALAAR